jgi:hypothetical protein
MQACVFVMTKHYFQSWMVKAEPPDSRKLDLLVIFNYLNPFHKEHAQMLLKYCSNETFFCQMFCSLGKRATLKPLLFSVHLADLQFLVLPASTVQDSALSTTPTSSF